MKDLILRLLTGWLAAMALLSVVGCAYHAPTAPDPPAPVSTRDPYTLTLGSFTEAGLTTVTAKVQNINGAPLADVTVTFTTDVGTLSSTSVFTSATGMATTTIAASSAASITATAGTVTAHTLIASQPVVNVPTPTPTPTTPTPTPGTTPLGPLSVTLTTASDVTIGAQTIFSATVTNGPATSVVWNFGDGATFSGISTTNVHTYPAAGNYAASVNVTDATGRRATGATTVTVNALPPPPPPPPPTAPTLAATLTCTAGTRTSTPTVCNVSASEGGASVTSDIRSDGVAWEWGDGTPVGHVGVLSQHQYTQSGTYTVSVTVDHGSARGLTSKQVVIP